eukprot:SAG11_NODE_19446_length_466_cov_1.119891_1_plen_65_part_00
MRGQTSRAMLSVSQPIPTYEIDQILDIVAAEAWVGLRRAFVGIWRPKRRPDHTEVVARETATNV